MRKDRHENRLEGSVATVKSVPKPPPNFDKRHKDMWERVCKDALNLGVLTEQDVYQVEMFVTNWFLWQDAVADIKKRGATVSVPTAYGSKMSPNPSLTVMNDSARVCQNIADKFGFSPRARMGIRSSERRDQKAKRESILDVVRSSARPGNASKTG